MASPCTVQPIIQQTGYDCGIASLVMMLGEPYPNVNQAAGQSLKKWPDPEGLSTRQLQTIAKKLGHVLQSVSIKDLDLHDSTGILLVRIKNYHHFVALFEGVLIDPSSGLLWNLDTFLHSEKAHPVRFLRP